MLGPLGPHPLGTGGGWLSPCSLFLHMCYHTEFRPCKSNRLGIGSGSKNLRDTGPHLLGWGVADPLKHNTPQLCYRTKCRRCTSSRFGASKGPKKFGDAGNWGWLTPRNMLFPQLLSCKIRSF